MNCTKQGHAGVPSVVSTITHAWCRACALDLLLPAIDSSDMPSEDNGTVNTLQAAMFNLGVDLDRRKALTGEAVHVELVKFFRAVGAEDISACLSYHRQHSGSMAAAYIPPPATVIADELSLTLNRATIRSPYWDAIHIMEAMVQIMVRAGHKQASTEVEFVTNLIDIGHESEFKELAALFYDAKVKTMRTAISVLIGHMDAHHIPWVKIDQFRKAYPPTLPASVMPEAIGPDIVQSPLSPYGYLQLVMEKLESAGYPVIAAMVGDTTASKTSPAKRTLYQALMYVDRGQPLSKITELLVTYYCQINENQNADMLKSAFLPLSAIVPEQEFTALVPQGEMTMHQSSMLTEGDRALRAAADVLNDLRHYNASQEVLSIINHPLIEAKWDLFERLQKLGNINSMRSTLVACRNYLTSINAPHPYIESYLLEGVCNP